MALPYKQTFSQMSFEVQGALTVSLLLEQRETQLQGRVGTFMLAELPLAPVYSSFQEGVSS